MSVEGNPHTRFGFEYAFLFDGTWQVKGDPDPYIKLVVAYINVLGSTLQREGVSPRRLRIAPFPDFSYRVVPTHDAVFIVLGESGSRTTRYAFYQDRPELPAPGLETQIKECEEVLGWDHCLGAQFPLSALTSMEQLNQAAETAAQITATQLVSTMQGSQIEEHSSTARQEIQSMLTLVADPDLRQRCEDLLSADKHYDRVIREACVILEDRVRKAIGAENHVVGTALMEQAFSPKGGVLQVSTYEPEQRGVMNLYSGIMAVFRNTASHHVADTYTRDDALRFVLWVDVLLKMITTISPKEKRHSASPTTHPVAPSAPQQVVAPGPAVPTDAAKGTTKTPPPKEKKAPVTKQKKTPVKASVKTSTADQGVQPSSKKAKAARTDQPVSLSPSPSHIPQGSDRQHMISCLVVTYKEALQDHPDGWIPITTFGSKLILHHPTFKATFYPTMRLPTFLKQQTEIFQTRTKNKHLEVRLLEEPTVQTKAPAVPSAANLAKKRKHT